MKDLGRESTGLGLGTPSHLPVSRAGWKHLSRAPQQALDHQREGNNSSHRLFLALYLWGYVMFVRMDDLQVHKQFPEDQQGVHNDQADNNDLLAKN